MEVDRLPTLRKGSAAKRMRQNEMQRHRNKVIRSEVRTACRKFQSIVDASDKEGAAAQYKIVTKLIDTAAGKGVFHKNTAARKKSRLYKAMIDIA